MSKSGAPKIIQLFSNYTLLLITSALIYALYLFLNLTLNSLSNPIVEYLISYAVVQEKYNDEDYSSSNVTKSANNIIRLEENDPDYSALVKLRKNFTKYYTEGNVDGIVKLFDKDGRVNNSVSHPNIQKFYTEFLSSNNVQKLEFPFFELTKKNDKYIDSGINVLTVNNRTFKGNYIMTAVKKNNKLYIKSLVTNE